MKLKRKYSNVIYANLRYEKLCLKQEKKCDESIYFYITLFFEKKNSGIKSVPLITSIHLQRFSIPK